MFAMGKIGIGYDNRVGTQLLRTVRGVWHKTLEWLSDGSGDPDRQKANTKEEETDLSLLNEGFRYRDLDTGTFLTRDPIGYGDGSNIYCYVHCNPITKFDALGLTAEQDEADLAAAEEARAAAENNAENAKDLAKKGVKKKKKKGKKGSSRQDKPSVWGLMKL